MNTKLRLLERVRHAIVCAILLVLAGPLLANDDLQLSLLTESEYLGEIPTVVTASRMPQLQSEAPAAVTVIDSEMIQASGARSLADLLVHVPGFQLGHFNSNHPVVTYHGLSDQYPRYMQVLVDGRSVYSPMFKGAFWSDLTIALENIERIEVIRGPNTVTYGSNAYSGVINIITRHASQQMGTYVKAVAGDNTIRDMTFRHGWRVGGNDFRVTASWKEDSGFKSRNDDVRVSFLDFSGDLRLSANSSLELNAGINENTYLDDFIESNIPIIPKDKKVVSHYQQIRWVNSINQTDELSLQFFHRYREQKLSTQTVPVDLSMWGFGVIQAPLSYNASEHRYDFELQHILQASENINLVWGFGSRLDEMESISFFADDLTRRNKVNRAFSNAEWRASSKIIVNAGVIVEDSDVAGTDVSPRLAMNYHFTPIHTLRAGVSKATRMPAIVENEGNQQYTYGGALFNQQILGTGGLDSEKVTTYELAYLGRSNKYNLSWGVRVYEDHIKDRIVEITVPVAQLFPPFEAYSYINQGQITVSGQELEINYRPSNNFRWVLNYAHMKAKARDFNPATELTHSAEVLERSVPGNSFSTMLMYRFKQNWQATLSAYQIDDMEWLGDGHPTGDYVRTDFNIAKEFTLKESIARLAITIQGIGDEYHDFKTDNVSDTRYFASFEYQF